MPRRRSDAKLAIEASEFLGSRRSSSSSNELRKVVDDDQETEDEKEEQEEEAEFDENEVEEAEDEDDEEEEEEEVVPLQISRSGRSIKKVISAKEELDYIQATTGRKPRDANAKPAAAATTVRGGRQTKKPVPSVTEMSTDSENEDNDEEEEEEEENHRPSNKRNTLDRNELVQAEQTSLTSLSGLRNSLQPFVSRKSFAALEAAATQRPKSNNKSSSSSSSGHRRDGKDVTENEVEEDGFTAQPDTIKNCTMRSYQLEGLSWLVSHYHRCINCILADEMYVTIIIYIF